MNEPKSFCFLLPLVAGLAVPLLTLFCVAALYGSLPIGDIFVDGIKQMLSHLPAIVIGLIPFALLSALLFLFRNQPPRASWCMCLPGLAGAAGFTILLHTAYWHPIYAGGHVSSTAVIVFVLAPIYGSIAAVVGFLGGLVVSRLRWFRQESSSPAG